MLFGSNSEIYFSTRVLIFINISRCYGPVIGPVWPAVGLEFLVIWQAFYR